MLVEGHRTLNMGENFQMRLRRARRKVTASARKNRRARFCVTERTLSELDNTCRHTQRVR